MSKKRTGFIIGIILVLVAAGIVIWAVQSNVNPSVDETEQTAANTDNTVPSLPDSTVNTTLPDGDKTPEQPDTVKQTPDEFLRNATNYDGTGLISLNMKKDELLNLLKVNSISYEQDKDVIIVSGDKNKNQYMFSNNKLFYIMLLGSNGGGIQELNIGGTVADMKKLLGSTYNAGQDTHNGPTLFNYKPKEGMLFIVTTNGEKANSKIYDIEILVPSYFDGIYDSVYNSL